MSRPVAVLLALAACSSPETAESRTQGPDDSGTAADTALPSAYDDLGLFVCHPDLPTDPCREGLDVTAVAADGTTTLVPHQVDPSPEADCFYVYPTVSADHGANADRIDDGPEGFMTQAQAGPYSSVCAVHAPMYRQITITGLLDPAADADLAYGDVLEAFEATIATTERPFFVIGHSQGTGHLVRLLAERIETDEGLRERLVAAHLFGGQVEVPDGATVGGSFATLPPCTSPSDTSCVVHHVTYRQDDPPTTSSLFGRTGTHPVLCTHPGALSGGPAPLRGRFPIHTPPEVASIVGNEVGPYADRARNADIPTAFYSVPGLLDGACTTDGTSTWLEITVNADPEDPRADQVQGDLILPGWGLHLVDMAVASDDLVDLAQAQLEAHLDAR